MHVRCTCVVGARGTASISDKNPRRIFEDGTDRLSRNVRKKLPLSLLNNLGKRVLRQVKVAWCIIVLHAVNVFGAVEGQVYAFFTSALFGVGGYCVTARCDCSTPRKRRYVIVYIRLFLSQNLSGCCRKVENIYQDSDPVCLVAHSVFFTLSAEQSRLHHQKDRLQRNIEARSRNLCYCGKAISITYSECVSVVWVIQHAQRMRRIILSTVVCQSLPYFSVLSYRLHHYWKKVIKHKMCVLIFCTTFFLNIYHLRRIPRDIFINVHTSAHKVPVILARF